MPKGEINIVHGGVELQEYVINCINACAGMTDPIAEIGVMKTSHREYLLTRVLLRDSEKQNAELLEALKAAAINPNQQIVSETILKYTK